MKQRAQLVVVAPATGALFSSKTTPDTGGVGSGTNSRSRETVSPSVTITCTKPGCGTQTTLAESTYIDGCGHICPTCAGPLPAWWNDMQPPY